MKAFLGTALAGILVLAATGGGQAGQIERACLQADREAASRALCGCIQQVANLTLDRRDQALAARFFRDPQMAQDFRQSGSRSHEIFWEKYKSFGSSAESYCG